MAWFIPAAKAVGSFLLSNWGSVAAVGAAGVSAYGTYQQGKYEQEAAYATAAQQDAQAKQERAVAQLEAARMRKAGLRQLSTQRNLSAASGFTADDPTSAHLASETVGAQTLEELLTLAQGEDTARQMEYAAKQTRIGGDETFKSGRIGAATTLLQGGMSWADRYGMGRRRRGGGISPTSTGGTGRAPQKRVYAG